MNKTKIIKDKENKKIKVLKSERDFFKRKYNSLVSRDTEEDILNFIRENFNCKRIYKAEYLSSSPQNEPYVIEFLNGLKIAIDLTSYILELKKISEKPLPLEYELEIKQRLKKNITNSYSGLFTWLYSDKS